jgi:hypothetical protein
VLTYVDDATSRLQLLRFIEGESTFDYMQATKLYIERYGKPVAFYRDKHTVFHVNKRSGVGGSGITQYGRALHELGIEIMRIASLRRCGWKASPRSQRLMPGWIPS